ncbi:Rossmann-like and DUF2520 domain-containing protein [Legionella jamestowniensis]|uniref:Pyrroline-5-carboxylate reductase n=1 Tax=Legionella jamestowniensis TaxID=455 RepID=A0A0W0UI70_9GAMM|nr:Rossmann-like and DUF2520 domain-containing protein [Legionella jamestowniensis]KTD07586.1 pyrroline-5-carboxylate reductase [Legionella jamestowniensis]OCH99334.1 hypothetical protein A8135_06505 [Legionella jamestowniensis]SFL58957.1 Predicted oxidoreductase, contains short-chain dehydrogenase (SDR) and DUF2520 domains [Legionella jamestowniensis DSM 19215]
MAVTTVNFIGAGNLGKTIGKLLCKSQLVKIHAICNRSLVNTSQAINFIGQGTYCESIKELPPADITFITTPDDCIEGIGRELASKSTQSGSVIVHCSGLLSSEVLQPLKNSGCFVASVHPMRSFANPAVSVEEFEGTYCAMEGDNEALSVLEVLFKAIGSKVYQIDKNKKPLYHAAGVFASNYLVTLAQQALECLKEAGVENEIAMKAIASLMKGTVSNLEKTLSPEKSLTGPIKRGDLLTIRKHINAFSSFKQRELYEMLGITTVNLTTHSNEVKNSLKAEFTNY